MSEFQRYIIRNHISLFVYVYVYNVMYTVCYIHLMSVTYKQNTNINITRVLCVLASL